MLGAGGRTLGVWAAGTAWHIFGLSATSAAALQGWRAGICTMSIGPWTALQRDKHRHWCHGHCNLCHSAWCKSRCLCHNPKEHWLCVSCGSVGTRLWTGQHLKALVPLWQAPDFNWHCIHTPWPCHVVSTRSQAALWAQVVEGSLLLSPGHGWDHWTLDHTVAWEQQLPVLQSPTLCHTQQCWAGRAKPWADAGDGAEAAGARLWWLRCASRRWKLSLCPALSLEQGSHVGTRAKGTCATSYTSVAVVRCSFQICLCG